MGERENDRTCHSQEGQNASEGRAKRRVLPYLAAFLCLSVIGLYLMEAVYWWKQGIPMSKWPKILMGVFLIYCLACAAIFGGPMAFLYSTPVCVLIFLFPWILCWVSRRIHGRMYRQLSGK